MPTFWGSDINNKALEAAQDLLSHNGLQGTHLVCSNLFAEIDANQKFDAIVFNPPYVVTEQDELDRAQETRGIEAAWAGGKHGIQVLFDFLPQARDRLTENGVIYLLLIDANMPLIPMLADRFGF